MFIGKIRVLKCVSPINGTFVKISKKIIKTDVLHSTLYMYVHVH